MHFLIYIYIYIFGQLFQTTWLSFGQLAILQQYESFCLLGSFSLKVMFDSKKGVALMVSYPTDNNFFR